jgi:translation initiation factor IF-1
MWRNMKIKRILLVVCTCIVSCLIMSCVTVNLAPDSEIEEQITEAGVALLRIPGDTTKNYVKDLKGDMVPVEMRTLEKMLKGDRGKTLQHLVFYCAGARNLLPDQKQYETRGWVTLVIAAYFNFRPEEVEQAAKLMPSTKELQGVIDDLMAQAKANHPTTDSTVPSEGTPSDVQ